MTDEILMAYADGELDETVRSAVEEAIAHDPALSQRVAEYTRSRRLVQTALSTDDYLAVPPDLRAKVIQQVSTVTEKARKSAAVAAPVNLGATRPTASARSQTLHYLLPLAASLVAVAIGIGIFFVGRWTGSDRSPEQSIIARLGSPAVLAALGTVASGQSNSLAEGQLRVIATYRSGSGALCREFTLQGASDKANAVACRSKSDWNVAFALVEPARPSGYAPADGSDLIGSYLQRLNAGDPLEPSLEKKALSASE